MGQSVGIKCAVWSILKPTHVSLGEMSRNRDMAESINTARSGVEGHWHCVEVREIEALEAAVTACMKKLGAIEYVM